MILLASVFGETLVYYGMANKRNICILGYGSQGRAWALNLRDAGCNLIIGLPSGSKSRRIALKDKIGKIQSTSEAVANSDIIIFAFPDHLHGRVFKKDIRPKLKRGCALIFLHGYSVHFGTVTPPEWCDVILLAPLGPGLAVRENFLNKESMGFFYSIHRNFSGSAGNILNFLVKSLRIDRKKLIRTTFADEAVGDIFGEQAVLCGGLSQLIKAGYDVLVESGLSPDKAYLEIAYQLDLIIDLIKKFGVEGMLNRISFTARYGSIRSGSRIIDKQVKARMKKLLAEIKKGKFAGALENLSVQDIKKMPGKVKQMSTPSFEKSSRKFSPKK